MKILNKFHFKNSPNPSNSEYIGRPSKWGNPFSHLSNTLAEFKVKDRDEAVDSYRNWIMNNKKLMSELEELRGKDLVCWCHPKKCHGDILKELLGEE